MRDTGSERFLDEIGRFAAAHRLIWGVCGPERLSGVEPRLAAADTPFVPRDTALRVDPRLTMPDAKSIVVVGLESGKAAGYTPDGSLRGVMSADAVGEDYHVTLTALLEALALKLRAAGPLRFKAFADNGPLAERPLAHRAGLGVYGRNGSLVSPVIGSFFHIGYMLTDLALPAFPFEPDKPWMADACRECRECVAACPSGALSAGETPTCDARACVSYLTQKKGVLTRDEMKRTGMRLYGCDVCRSVCPYNRGKTGEPVFDIEQMNPALVELAEMSDAVFAARFKSTSAGWRGRRTLRRNALIALGNSADARARKTLQAFAGHEDPVLSETARAALSMFDG